MTPDGELLIFFVKRKGFCISECVKIPLSKKDGFLRGGSKRE